MNIQNIRKLLFIAGVVVTGVNFYFLADNIVMHTYDYIPINMIAVLAGLYTMYVTRPRRINARV